MTKSELEIRLRKAKVKLNSELIDKIILIKTNEDFDLFEKYLSECGLSNDDEYEYYNAAYYQLYGEESNAYKED